MHTILGSTGQIAIELARELHRLGHRELRLVSRHPKAVNDSDVVRAADLLDDQQTIDAVDGSHTVWFTAGLPPDTSRWRRQFPIMLGNAIVAARRANARLVFFDNTYMYPQDGRVLDEDTAFAPVGAKGRVRMQLAQQVVSMMRSGMPALIARAPEFYGPDRTKSITNSLVITPLLAGRPARVPVRDDVRRSLIWTPDASRALALLGTTDDAFGHTWHLPVDDDRLDYAQLVRLAADVFGTAPSYKVLPKWQMQLAGLLSSTARELWELLPRYGHDNIFVSAKFKQRFPDFRVTTYREGLAQIAAHRR
ncbi:MAG TPA: NAD-dependent epimerase/dehydratase family protein [Myxococcota bacterium]